MRVIQVLPRISEEASGPSYSVRRTCESLARAGARVELNVLGAAPDAAADGRAFDVRSHPYLQLPRSIGWSPAMYRHLREQCRTADVVHGHSLWMMPNVYPAWAASGSRCRIVTAPRGTLAPWALNRSRWRKRLMWWLCQGSAARAAHCFHATAPHEIEQIRAAGLRAPVAVIPNGADVPAAHRQLNEDPSRLKRLLFLGRIAPVKGVDLLLRAWKAVQGRFPDWELRVVGRNDAGYADTIASLAAEMKLERFTLAGPAYGQAKVDELLAADLFVLPTHTENFGNAVGEALAYAVPVVVSRGAPWPGIVTNDCGWWIDRGEGPLTECLDVAFRTSPAQLHAMGLRGRDWIARDFSWDRIAAMTLDLYDWLLGGSNGSAPAFVSTN